MFGGREDIFNIDRVLSNERNFSGISFGHMESEDTFISDIIIDINESDSIIDTFIGEIV